METSLPGYFVFPGVRISVLVRALRLPFLTVSTLPFICGSVAVPGPFNAAPFLVGLLSVVCTHLGANVLNDYGDSVSGADWRDRKYYTYFGGSKLIQNGTLKESFYRRAGTILITAGFLSATGLAVMLQDGLVVLYYMIILAAAVSYSLKPLQLSYHRLGEMLIFVIFGPAAVAAGMYAQTGMFPDWNHMLISLPFGLLAVLVLVANEVPDYLTDRLAGKYTLVSLTGPRYACILYLIIAAGVPATILMNFYYGNTGYFSLLSFALFFLAVGSGYIQYKWVDDKNELVRSSRLSTLFQTLTGLVLIADLLVHSVPK